MSRWNDECAYKVEWHAYDERKAHKPKVSTYFFTANNSVNCKTNSCQAEDVLQPQTKMLQEENFL